MSRALAVTAAGLFGMGVFRALRRRPVRPQLAPQRAPSEISSVHGRRLTTSTASRAGTVLQSPKSLLLQAQATIPDLTMDEYTAARMIASEWGTGPETALRAMVEAERNRARRKNRPMFDVLTSNGTFGRQGGKNGPRTPARPAATTRDPHERHALTARAVLRGQFPDLAKGATRFFDPQTQHGLYLAWQSGERDRRACHPRMILDRWSWNLEWADKRCGLDWSGKRPSLAWIGPVKGIDPIRLFLFRPERKKTTHKAQYEAAAGLLGKHYPTVGDAAKNAAEKLLQWIARRTVTVHPLPSLEDGRTSRITSMFRTTSRKDHDGTDHFYKVHTNDPKWRTGDGNGTTNRKWIVPPGTPAIAVDKGTVQRAENSATGWLVWIDHGGFRSGYFHLKELFVKRGQSVDAGVQLGLVGDNPSDHDARHLHFEISPTNKYRPVDPRPYLAGARHLPLVNTSGRVRRVLK